MVKRNFSNCYALNDFLTSYTFERYDCNAENSNHFSWSSFWKLLIDEHLLGCKVPMTILEILKSFWHSQTRCYVIDSVIRKVTYRQSCWRYIRFKLSILFFAIGKNEAISTCSENQRSNYCYRRWDISTVVTKMGRRLLLCNHCGQYYFNYGSYRGILSWKLMKRKLTSFCS